MPRIKPPDNESREERFKRLAKKRTEDIIDRIRVLRHCANRSAYRYTPEQVQTIFSAIREVLDRAEADFVREEGRREIKL